jgi:hypothetical protein
MLRKDYIMRQFEEFGKVMAVIFGLKKEKDWENFEKEIANATKKFTPFQIEHVEKLSESEFKNEVVASPSLLPDQQKILADLLFEKMNIYLEINNEEKYLDLKNKCLLLYKAYLNNLTQNEFNLDVHYKIDFLNKLD